MVLIFHVIETSSTSSNSPLSTRSGETHLWLAAVDGSLTAVIFYLTASYLIPSDIISSLHLDSD